MKTRNILRMLAAGTVLAAGASVAHAQSFGQSYGHAPTHAELQRELAQLEAAGYDPHRDSADYPADLQAAEQRLSQRQQDNNMAMENDARPQRAPAS